MGKLVLYSKMNPNINDENMRKINQRLLDMIGYKNAKVGYIASETDKDRRYFNKTKHYYELLGINNIKYFDLEYEYDESKEDELFDSDIIHLTSGNTFKFLSLLRKRNMISKIRDYSINGGILVGVSAGSVLMGSSIEIAKFADLNNIASTDFEGLKLIDFEIKPHWNRWEDKIYEFKKYSKDRGREIYLIRDGEGIVVENGKVDVYGDIIIL
ncbi:MAG: Type 1 glutamine amidotransferase-like domain-containing protein [Peptostreptococcaceae bacterium]